MLYILAGICYESTYSISSFVYIRNHYRTNYHNNDNYFHIWDSNNNHVHNEANRIFDAKGNNNKDNEADRIDDDNADNNDDEIIFTFEHNFRYY